MVTSDLALSAAARLAPAVSTPSYTKKKKREKRKEKKKKEKRRKEGEQINNKKKKKRERQVCKPSALCSGN